MDTQHLDDEETVRETFIQLLRDGVTIRCAADGVSMSPTIRAGDYVVIAPAGPDEVSVGDIVALTRDSHRLLVHRLIEKTCVNGEWFLTTKGDADCGRGGDRPVGAQALVGKVIRRERSGVSADLCSLRFTLLGRTIALMQKHCPGFHRWLRRTVRTIRSAFA